MVTKRFAMVRDQLKRGKFARQFDAGRGKRDMPLFCELANHGSQFPVPPLKPTVPRELRVEKEKGQSVRAKLLFQVGQKRSSESRNLVLSIVIVRPHARIES